MTQTVVVTGASRGLGAAIARLAAQLGANVVLNARSVGDLEQIAQNIRKTGGTALIAAGDVSQPEECQAVVKQAIERFGRIDALVNNAGILEPLEPIASSTLDAWQQNLAVNLLGPIALTQVALPHLRENNGRVVNVSSGAALDPIAGAAAYSVAKAALNQFTQALAGEERDITAIAFRPGVVDTEMQALIRRTGEEGMPPEVYESFVRYHREGELLPPEIPGRAGAILALYVPHAWSGEFLSWNADKVQALESEKAS